MMGRMTGMMMLILAMALAGCQGMDVKQGWDDVGHSVGGLVAGDRTEDLQGRFIDGLDPEHKHAAAEKTPAEIQQGFVSDINYLRYGNGTIARLPELEAYLNRVLARIAAQWPGRPVKAHAYITPDSGFQAHTLPHGAIFISLGALLAIENEDQLAALLGHEYAHVALEHHAKDRLQLFSSTAFRYANLYLQAESASGEYVQDRALKLRMAQWVSDKAMFPNWNRGQENEADVLGTDLLIRAGYNADAMIAILKLVQASVQAKQDFMAARPVQMQKGKGGDVLATMSLQQFATSLLGSLEDELAQDYEAAEERQKRIRSYLKREYRKRARPAFGSAPYLAAMNAPQTAMRLAQYRYAHQAEQYAVEGRALDKAASLGQRSLGGAIGDDPYTRLLMYNIRNIQGRSDKARINLQKAYQSGAAPMYAYELLSVQAIERADYQQALRILEEMDAQFSSPKEILPSLILVKRRLGQPVVMEGLRCLVTADQELIQRCKAAQSR